VSRTVDERLRDDLLERIVDYVLDNGISDLQLRPLAKAVGSSPRGLLYHFKSKEELVVAVLARVGLRQRELFNAIPHAPGSFRETINSVWAILSAPKNEGIFRLFFEIYGLALQDRERYPGFLERAIESWLSFVGDPMIAFGYSRATARAMATVVLAGFRGFLLDLCTTNDRRRINRAVELWIHALEQSPPPIEVVHGR
jgi:AcrR family transcriptional regulator